MNTFFFGMGYSSLASARAIHAELDAEAVISGTTRSPDNADLSSTSYRIHLFDGAAPGPTLSEDLRAATHVVLSIPPDAEGDPALRHHQPDLDAAENLKWLCYYSTVGVYGDFGGDWIDESGPTRPINPRSKLRVEVEQHWRDYAERRGVPLTILRIAGIYGPGRSAIDKLRAGEARRIVKAGQVFNRIHVDDIGRVTMLAARQLLDGTFNLSDDEPAPPQELVSYAAELIGMAPPPEIPFEEAQLTAMARSFYSDNKRVSNRRIKAALGVNLLYPTYRDGLRAIYELHA